MAAERKYEKVELDLIDKSPWQPRQDLGDIAGLAKDIAESRLIHVPVLRRNPDGSGRFQTVGGHRRVEAVRLLGWRAVDAEIIIVSDEMMASMAAKENIHRQNLNVLEHALAYRNMVNDFGWSQQRVAAEFKISTSQVSNRLRILEQLPEQVHKLIAADILSETHAKTLCSISDVPLKVLELTDLTVTSKWSTRELEAEVSKVREAEDARLAKEKEKKDAANKQHGLALDTPELPSDDEAEPERAIYYHSGDERYMVPGTLLSVKDGNASIRPADNGPVIVVPVAQVVWEFPAELEGAATAASSGLEETAQTAKDLLNALNADAKAEQETGTTEPVDKTVEETFSDPGSENPAAETVPATSDAPATDTASTQNSSPAAPAASTPTSAPKPKPKPAATPAAPERTGSTMALIPNAEDDWLGERGLTPAVACALYRRFHQACEDAGVEVEVMISQIEATAVQYPEDV